MAFVLQNTISVTDAASFHSAHVYFWDTLVAGSTGWSVGAHPDSSSFKRKVSYTFSDNINNPGNPFTTYLWVNWTSATPASTNQMKVYLDDTYTSVKQDLCTYVNHLLAYVPDVASYAGNHKFWRSDQNDRAFIWTYGTYVFCFSAGPTTCIGYPDTDWENDANGAETFRSQYNPLTNASGYVQLSGAPLYSSPTATNEVNISPDYYGAYPASGATQISNFQDLGPSDTSIFYPIHYPYSSYPLMWGCSTDVRVFYPHTQSSANLDFSIGTGNTKKLVNGTDWYFGRPATDQPTLQFFFGTSEPDFSF